MFFIKKTFTFFFASFFLYVAANGVVQAEAKKQGDSNAGRNIAFAIPGNLTVSAKGSLSYSIPLSIAPAITNPRLSLEYDSGAGPGILGLGWKIGGLQSITLCRLTRRQDGIWGNISLNEGKESYQDNRFCWNSQRLVATSGAYGADGTLYATEHFRAHRIRSVGTCGNGPCGFEIDLQNGGRLVFGMANDAILSIQNKDILAWGITKKTDRNGNEIVFGYDATTEDNILYPDTIQYGGNALTKEKHNRTIKFNYRTVSYQPRQPRYIGTGGTQIKRTRMLENITSSLEGNVVYKHNFTQILNKALNVYQLTQFQICAKDGNTLCYTPTRFSYPETQANLPVNFERSDIVNLGSTSAKWEETRAIVMDKYGSGYDGVALITRENDQAIFRFAASNKQGRFSPSVSQSVSLDSYGVGEHAFPFLLMDKDGDGVKDLVKIFRGSDGSTLAQAYLSVLGTGTFTRETNVQRIDDTYISSGDNKPSYINRDLNGDGLQDLVQIKPVVSEKNGVTTYAITAFYSSPSGGFPTRVDVNRQINGDIVPVQAQSINFVDVNNDRLSDFFILGSGQSFSGQSDIPKNFDVFASALYNRQSVLNGPEGTTQNLVSLGRNDDWQTIPAYKWTDFNQDGLKDLVLFRFQDNTPLNGEIWINQGKSFAQMLLSPQDPDNVTAPFIASQQPENKDIIRSAQFIDMTADGRPDLVKYQGGGGQPSSTSNTWFEIYAHTGTSYAYRGRTPTFGANTRNLVIDLGADGVGDIVSIQQENEQLTLSAWKNQNDPQYVTVEKIENGLQSTVQVSYDLITGQPESLQTSKPVDYPLITLNRPRRLVSEVIRANGSVAPYASSVLEQYRYWGSIYNRLDWIFLGFQQVDKIQPAKSQRIEREYYLKFPLTGSVRNETNIDTKNNAILSKKIYENDVVEIYPQTIPKVLSPRLQTHQTLSYASTTQASSVQEPQISLKRTIAYNYAPVKTPNGFYGNVLWTAQTVNGSDETLYRCYTYLNDTQNSNWIVGLRTGILSAKKNSCSQFTDPEMYQWNPQQDLKFFSTRYSKDGRYNVSSFYAYENSVDSFRGSEFTYTPQGQLATQDAHTAFTRRNGAYPSEDQITRTTNHYDEYGFLKERVVTGGGLQLSTSYVNDPRFGHATMITAPNGRRVKTSYNDLGLVDGHYDTSPDNQLVMVSSNTSSLLSSGGYTSETRARINWSDDVIHNWPFTRNFYDGDNNLYLKQKSFEEDKIIDTTRRWRDQNTGLIIRTFQPSFNTTADQEKAFSDLSYDNRFQLASVRRSNSYTMQIARKYADGQIKINYLGPDPRTTQGPENPSEKGLVLRIAQVQDYINRSETALWPDGTQTTTTSSLVGLQRTRKDSRNLITTRDLTSSGFFRCFTAPDIGKICNEHNAKGQITSQTYADGTRITYDYDGLSRQTRVVSTSPASGQVVTSYRYDEERQGYFNKGYATTIMRDDVILEYDYTPKGNIARRVLRTPNDTYTFTYEYNTLSNVISITYPDKSTVKHTYDPVSTVLKNISYFDAYGQAVSEAAVSFFDYTALHTPQKVIYGNNKLQASYQFDPWGLFLQNSLASNADKNILSRENYTYNTANKLIRSESLNGAVKTYMYDVNGRLVKANGISSKTGSVSYSYDANNNITQKGDLSFYIDQKSNRLLKSRSSGQKILSISYNSTGLPVRKEEGSQSITYAYGPDRRIQSITNGSQSTQYRYTPRLRVLGRLFKKDGRTVEERLFLGDGFEILKKNGTKKIIKRISDGNLVYFNIVGDENGVKTHYQFADRQGNLTHVLDAQNLSVLKKWDYEPYGTPIALNAGQEFDSQPEFTGNPWDENTGLYDLGLRNYTPVTGRYLVPDPAMQYSSAYVYGSGDPLSGRDAAGLFFGLDDLIEALAATIITEAVQTAATVTASNLAAETTGAEVSATIATAGAGATESTLVATTSVSATVAIGEVGATASTVSDSITVAGETATNILPQFSNTLSEVTADTTSSTDGQNIGAGLSLDSRATSSDSESQLDLIRARIQRISDRRSETRVLIRNSTTIDVTDSTIEVHSVFPDYITNLHGAERGPSEFVNIFDPENRYINFYSNYRSPNAPFTASDVAREQFLLLNEDQQFVPRVINRVGIQNEMGSRILTEFNGSRQTQALFDSFLRQSQNGRSSWRIATEFGLRPVSASVAGDETVSIFVEPDLTIPEDFQLPARTPGFSPENTRPIPPAFETTPNAESEALPPHRRCCVLQ
ncbi:MAG: hypothetical protein N0E44_19545 [Candidatus Thiodiazotropha lotti]|nr:hypothetical protein [Candidatus Thiodiazotropha lotti]MCW4222075.1 hypothetical protein [Candidatus Thiodiazotropha lotti]